MGRVNSNSILFLYEGATELEFYDAIFSLLLPHRLIRIKKKNIKGQYNLNKKVEAAILQYLEDKPTEKNIYVFIAHDREGPREKESMLDLDYFNVNFINKKGNRIKLVDEIIATQDLESWFFVDLDGVYQHLDVPKSRRNFKKYRNIEAMNYRVLSQLFRKHGKMYFKGERVEGLIDHLDLQKIYDSIEELQVAINKMKKLIK